MEEDFKKLQEQAEEFATKYGKIKIEPTEREIVDSDRKLRKIDGRAPYKSRSFKVKDEKGWL